ncbi:MAG: DUF1800 domain-containing protein [Chloroflexi bacterium]|nr:DUF1800 domain-containing protein [Chloroflexota bacterium]
MDKISRRDFLKLSGFASTLTLLWGCAPGAASTAVALPTQLPPTDDDLSLFNALKRIGLGPTPADVESVQRSGFEAFVESQLAYEQIDDSAIAKRISQFETLTMPVKELAVLAKPSQPVFELIQATMLRAAYSPRQLYERMVHFWTDHFNIYILKSQDRFLKTGDDRDVIRPNALGNFHALLSASMHSPAMMVYLDNASSTKDGPNENYARELLELHTLGVDGGYTQQDILEVARALTGWSVTGRRDMDNAGDFMFKPFFHDDGAKHILSVDFPAGQGAEDGEQLARLLAEHPSTASFISYKLARHFVSDEPPADLVSKVAQVFQSSGGDVRELLRAIFFSEEFNASLGTGKLKRPVEFVTSAIRQLGIETEFERPMFRLTQVMGQVPFFWSAPNGYPDVGKAWLNSNDLLARWNFALSIATNSVRDSHVDLSEFSGKPESEIVDALSLRLLGFMLPDEPRSKLIETISSISDVDPETSACALLLASPYFQYR